MTWTVASLREAYRLSETDSLIASALADAEYNERRWLGKRANGGTMEYIWHLRLPADWWHPSLGLPAQAEELLSIVGSNDANTQRAILSDDGWTIRKTNWSWFYGGTITAQVRLFDDTAHRDMLVASLVQQAIGQHDNEGRGWRRLLKDMRGPSFPSRLPDIRNIVVKGDPSPPHTIYVGLADGVTEGVTLGALDAYQTDAFNLPTWTGHKYLVFVRNAAVGIESIQIGGIDQIAVFDESTFTEGGQAYTEYRSRRAWNGEIASGASVRIA